MLLLLLAAGAAHGQVPAPAATHRIDRLPQPAATTDAPIDIEALAREYEAAGVGRPAPAQPVRLLVFVSLAMPQGALRRLMADGERVGAVLLLRGLEGGSLRRTSERVRQLAGERAGAIQIDPQAFLRYGVAHVPVFVLAKRDSVQNACQAAGCAAPDGFVSVAGDVTIDYALRHVVSNAPGFAAPARQLLRTLEP